MQDQNTILPPLSPLTPSAIHQGAAQILKDRYRITDILKSDTKGDVFKAIYFKYLMPKWCVIKQGKRNTYADEHGRNIYDRLIHQRDIHAILRGKAPLPAIIDFFSEGGDSYFVMQLIKGQLFEHRAAEILGGLSWDNLPVNNRLLLIDYILQMLGTIQTFHQNGIVHRDITPANFIEDRKNCLWVIDLELSFLLDQVGPPFKLGTAGYMSPEQLAEKIPTIQEDIYGIGAFMIPIFTGLQPIKFEENKDILRDQLHFFIQDEKIVSLILSCLSFDPADRPALVFIQKTITEIRSEYNAGRIPAIGLCSVKRKTLSETIDTGILGLTGPAMLTDGPLWAYCPNASACLIANNQFEKVVNMGLETGIAGILYVLARTDQNSFFCGDQYNTNLKYLQDHFHSLPAGLFNGSAGVAVALAEGIKNCVIVNSEANRWIIRQSLKFTTKEINLASGAAGIGLALICCADFFDGSELSGLLQSHVKTILNRQQKNGSWLSVNKTSNTFDFIGGMAGITCFLLYYYERYKDEQVRQSTENSLRWLVKLADKKANDFSPWLCEGSAGVALCFLKAYEILKVQKFRLLAERILNVHPLHITSYLFGQASGLAGLGEVYIEADRILSGRIWQNRAERIAGVFANTCKQDGHGGLYWITHKGNLITADFMTGCGGIVHFLNRLLHPSKFGFPFLPSV